MQVSTGIPSGARILSGYINTYNREINNSLERLGSGLRVNRPSDDSLSYFKAQTLNRRAESTMDISRALENHIGRLNTASEALDTARSMLIDMQALAKEASEEDNAAIRGDLAKEFESKKDAYSELIYSTTYEGAQLMTGSYDTDAGATGITVQVDEDPSNTYTYGILDAEYTSADGLNMQLGDAESGLKAWSDGVNGKTYALQFYNEFNSLDTDGVTPKSSGISKITRNVNRIETHLTILEGVRNNLVSRSANYEAAASAMVEVDEAEEATRFSALQIKQQASASFLAQFNVSQASLMGTIMASHQN